MSIMYLLTTDYPSGQIIEFNLQTAKEKSHKDVNAIFEKLQIKESLTTGKIYERVDNNDLWYVDDEKNIATFVTKKQLELLHRWDRKRLLPTDEQIKQLE